MKLKYLLHSFIAAVFIFSLSACLLRNAEVSSIENSRWELWEGRGKASISANAFIYEPASLQDEEYDYDIEGRGPALIAAKKIKGKKWVLDVRPAFFSSGKTYRRFTLGIWTGKGTARPSLGSKDATEVVTVSHSRGKTPSEHKTLLEIRAGGAKKTETLPNAITFLRFQREKNNITVYYSTGYVPKYSEAISIPIEGKQEVRFITGARYDGNPRPGEKMRITELTLDGKNFLE